MNRFSLKKLLAFALTLTVIGFASGSSSAQGKADRPEKPKVTGTRKLKPTANSAVTLDSVRILDWSDGSSTIEMSGTTDLRTKEQLLRVNVNKADDTYSVEVEGLDQELAELRARRQGRNTEPELGALGTGSQSAEVTVLTQDPVFIDVAESTLTLNWYVAASGTVQYLSRNKTAWAANPSPLDTHWFVDQQYFSGAGGVQYGYATSGNLITKFHNCDFGLDSKCTYVSHSSRIHGYSSKFQWFVSSSASGEFSYLLFTTGSASGTVPGQR